jgi:hypothetical protein
VAVFFRFTRGGLKKSLVLVRGLLLIKLSRVGTIEA